MKLSKLHWLCQGIGNKNGPNQTKARALLAAAVVGISGLFPTVAAAEINLTFGTYAADKPTETVLKMKPFLDYFEGELGRILKDEVTISMQLSSEYNESIDDLASGEIDFSRFGPASYVLAKRQNPEVEILAMEAIKGKKTFKGIIAVHLDSDIERLEDLAGRSFAFGNRLSTIGRFLAQGQLLDAGQTTETLGEQAYLGRHDRVGAAVGNGDYDAGACPSSYKMGHQSDLSTGGSGSFV